MTEIYKMKPYISVLHTHTSNVIEIDVYLLIIFQQQQIPSLQLSHSAGFGLFAQSKGVQPQFGHWILFSCVVLRLF